MCAVFIDIRIIHAFLLICQQIEFKSAYITIRLLLQRRAQL